MDSASFAAYTTNINKNNDKGASMEVHDLKDANGEIAGTEIILYIQTPL